MGSFCKLGQNFLSAVRAKITCIRYRCRHNDFQKMLFGVVYKTREFLFDIKTDMTDCQSSI